MAYTTFARHLALEANCGLALNLPALFRAAGDDWLTWLERLPLERLLQLDLQGLAPAQLPEAVRALEHLTAAGHLRAVMLPPSWPALPQALLQVLTHWLKRVGLR
jgi:hypothetical protein